MSSRNYYREIGTIAAMLRRMHAQEDVVTEEMTITVDPKMFRMILASARDEHSVPITKDPGVWNEFRIHGVVIREQEEGTRAHEREMLKRGFAKMWVAGRAT